MKGWLLGVLLGAFFVPIAWAQENIGLEIVKGRLSKIKIEIQNFQYFDVLRAPLSEGEWCEDVLTRDLEFSDFFDVKREMGFIPSPSDTSVSPISKAQAVATGEVRRRWGKVELQGELLDGREGKVIFRRTYPIGDPPDRWAVHAFADDIVLYLTGEAGVAQSRIAFVGQSGDSKEIYLVDYDGTRLSPLTRLGTIVISPRWSPKGDVIAFTSFGNGRPDLVQMRLADLLLTTLSSRPGINSAPCFAPGGGRLAASLSFEGNAELYLLEDAGRKAQRLTFSPSIETAPSFSPDGAKLCYTSDRSGQPHVYVMDSDGANARRLTYLGKWCDSPDWSPKGDRICFVALVDDAFDIFTMRPDGEDLRRLTAGEGSHENPRWAPDGRHLVYAKRSGKTRQIHVMAADGSGKRALTSFKGDQYNPAWSPPLRPSEER